MCGIIGIIGNEQVSYGLYCGLLALQHRGQDSAGILTYDNKINLKKGLGFASKVFNKENLSELKGNFGIGVARYTTAGYDREIDAQPFVNQIAKIGIVHNGNLVNYEEVKNELIRKKQFTSRCDTEAILNLFVETLKGLDVEDIFDAVKEIMKTIRGSYSVVLLTPIGLVAFRDENGIRPLIFGKREGSYCFCSETAVLDALEFKLVRDVKPGEAIYIDKNLNVSSKIIKKSKPAHCMFEWVYFSRADSANERRSVYEARLGLGRELAKEWGKKKREIDIVVPVPDTSRPAASTFSEEVGLKEREGLIKNRYIGRTFIMPTQAGREYAMKLNINPIVSEIKGKKIVLVDDSIVRGTTSKRIINIVRKAGAKEIHLLVTCPPIRYPCFYGIDMSIRKELIASNRKIEEIRAILGVDSLTYQTIEGLKKAINVDGLCTACLDGNYPIKVSEQKFLKLERIRAREKGEKVGLMEWFR